MFDYYAAMSGTSEDIYSLKSNDMRALSEDCSLVSELSAYCKQTHLDQMFVQARRWDQIEARLWCPTCVELA